MVVQILRVACNEGEGTSTHSCQRKSLLAVCAYKVTAHFQRPLNEWQGGEGKFTPATTAMHNDRLSGCRGHSCCLEITYRSTLLLWRMRFPGGLSTGWKQEELFRRETKTVSPGLWQATGAEDWARTGLPGVAAWMGEPPVRVLKWSSCGVEPTEGLAWPCLLQDLKCCFPTHGRWVESEGLCHLLHLQSFLALNLKPHLLFRNCDQCSNLNPHVKVHMHSPSAQKVMIFAFSSVTDVFHHAF